MTDGEQLTERLTRQAACNELPDLDTLRQEIILVCTLADTAAKAHMQLNDQYETIVGKLKHVVALGLELTSLKPISETRHREIRRELGVLQAYAENLL